MSNDFWTNQGSSLVTFKKKKNKEKIKLTLTKKESLSGLQNVNVINNPNLSQKEIKKKNVKIFFPFLFLLIILSPFLKTI